MSNDNYIQSVQRTMSVIQALIGISDGLSLNSLSEKVGLHKSTVYRILNTLKTENFIKQDESTLKYSLGYGFLVIALKFLGGFDLRRVAYPHMQELRDAVGESVNLSILDGDEIIYIERIVSDQPLHHSMKVGDRASAFHTAMGKAMLAFINEDSLRELLSENTLKNNNTSQNIDIEQLLNELSETQATRIAFDNRDHQEHICCIASPIFDAKNDVIGAISVSGPAFRMVDEKITFYKSKLLKAVQDISNELGWKMQ